MSSSSNNSHSILRGLRLFRPKNEKFVLVIIHGLESWFETRKREVLCKKNFKL